MADAGIPQKFGEAFRQFLWIAPPFIFFLVAVEESIARRFWSAAVLFVLCILCIIGAVVWSRLAKNTSAAPKGEEVENHEPTLFELLKAVSDGSKRLGWLPNKDNQHVEDFSRALNVHKIWAQMPRLSDGIIHLTVEFFNGNSFGLHIKGISGAAEVTKEDANGNKSKLCTLTTPSFAETRRTYVLPHDEFAFSLAQQLPPKLADEFRNWRVGTKYDFDLGGLNIIVQSESGRESVRLPLWDGFRLEKQDGRMSTSRQIILRPGSLLRGLSHLIETRE